MARPSIRESWDLSAVFGRYADRVHTVAHHLLRDRAIADDLVQEVFLMLWQHGDGFDAARGNLDTYLAAIIRHRAIDLLRSKRRATAGTCPLRTEQPAPPSPASAQQSRDELRESISWALRALSSDQRIAIVHAFMDGMSHADIAKRLRRPLGTVKSWVRQGLLRLRTELLFDAAECHWGRVS
jgi:RNA polymerase sigma-70 factor (ECF subfamily)